jgi:hypothetical protein
VRIALGCMRLSTEAARDEHVALATLKAAMDAGITMFDTRGPMGWIRTTPGTTNACWRAPGGSTAGRRTCG